MLDSTHLRKILPWPHVPSSLSIHSLNFSGTLLVLFLLPHHSKAFWKICLCSLSILLYFSFHLHLGFCSYHNSAIASFWTTDLQIATSNNAVAHFIWNCFPFLQLLKTFVYMAACFSNFLLIYNISLSPDRLMIPKVMSPLLTAPMTWFSHLLTSFWSSNRHLKLHVSQTEPWIPSSNP